MLLFDLLCNSVHVCAVASLLSAPRHAQPGKPLILVGNATLVVSEHASTCYPPSPNTHTRTQENRQNKHNPNPLTQPYPAWLAQASYTYSPGSV
jgi:hypothetical protein